MVKWEGSVPTIFEMHRESPQLARVAVKVGRRGGGEGEKLRRRTVAVEPPRRRGGGAGRHQEKSEGEEEEEHDEDVDDRCRGAVELEVGGSP